MKKTVLLFCLLLGNLALYAQEQQPVIPQRETIVVDNFTATPEITLGLYQYARQVILEGLAHRRVNVIDVEKDGVGRADIVYPSLNFAERNTGHPFDIDRAVKLMNEEYSSSRYYITVYLSRFKSHPVEHTSKDKDGNPVVKTDFTAEIEAEVYLLDADTGETIGPLRWKNYYNGASDPRYAERYAISGLESKARYLVTERFRFKASVIKLGEYNKRGKLEDLYLSCGSDMDVSRGDVFYVYSVSDIDGISTARKLGKVKAREITGRESCRCTVSNGEAEINKAFLAGDILIAVSDDDTWF